MGKINPSDLKWEKKLGIDTAAANFEKDDANHSRYEPTAYAVLERLAGSGFVGRDNTLVDYGCGKGRVPFFMNRMTGCRTIGVEYDHNLAKAAAENLKAYTGKAAEGAVSFLCISAENYIPDEADCFYFFNPFSSKILQSVLGRIKASCYARPRYMRLFFYYALDSYIDLMLSDDLIEFEEEIDCRDIFHNDDPREKILVYKIDIPS